ncbi:TPA: hypothetical protein DCW61_04160 [Candidatus Uhrbacteria bacterium]|nr:hypothetical protein [Candidatus Uhrbacteria bacterium]
MYISRTIGKKFGFIPANCITLFGGWLALLGIYLFTVNNDWFAIFVLTASFLTDWFDGTVSKYHESLRKAAGLSPLTLNEESYLSWWERFNHLGITHLGRWLDPLVDKIRFIGLLWVVGHSPLWITINLTAIAGLLTVIRPILRILELGDGGANSFGKRKMHLEVISMALLIFTTRPLFGEINTFYLIPFIHVITLLSLLGTLALAIASFSTHVYSGWLIYKARHI